MPVVDASVWVACFHSRDGHHARSRRWLEGALTERQTLASPASAVAEVAGAVSLLTGDPELARRALADLEELGLVGHTLTAERGRRSAEIAADYGLRGADAIYVQLAEERGEALITLDREQLDRAEPLVAVQRPP